MRKVLILFFLLLAMAPTMSMAAQEKAPPFALPFDEPPGPETWLLVQFYGNTTGAYRHRVAWYGAGQGLHFGVDFAARCGTEIVSIGDGEVISIDNTARGAGPHNLLIYHPDEGYVSLYGHLLRRPNLQIGQQVQQGQVIGQVGDPDGTCRSRPHLHLEIRSRDYGTAYNPIPLIDADWDTLALHGPFGKFQKDLSQPHQWQTPGDQPTVIFRGERLNDYDRTWPPDW